jgi:hypothetical protein
MYLYKVLQQIPIAESPKISTKKNGMMKKRKTKAEIGT